MTVGTHLFWLIPLLPLGVFVVLASGLGRYGRLAAGLAVGAAAASLALSALGLVAVCQGTRTVVNAPWLTVGGYRVELALWLDPLAILAATLVCIVGLIVLIYARGSMADEAHTGRFFAELSLFLGAMLILALSADLVLLFVAWELVGLCSYLLIGFRSERPGVASAATKALFITRLGDLGMLLGILLLIGAIGSGRIDTALSAVAVEGTAYERMGGLARRMPYTFIAFTVSAAALAGLPVAFAAAPEDPVLAAAWSASPMRFALTLLASLLATLYSARALALVFLGTASAAARHARPAPPGLSAPTLLLAALVLLGLLANATILGRPLARFLGVETPEAHAVTVLALMVAVSGVGLGRWARAAWPQRIIWPPLVRPAPLFSGEVGLPALYRSLARLWLRLVAAMDAGDRHSFDRVGSRLADLTLGAVRVANSLDRGVFDVAASRAAAAMLFAIRAGLRIDLGGVEAAATAFGQALLVASQRVRALQTGQVGNYLLVIFIWGLGLIALAALAMTLP